MTPDRPHTTRAAPAPGSSKASGASPRPADPRARRRARLRLTLVGLWLATLAAGHAGHRLAPGWTRSAPGAALVRALPWLRYPAVMFHTLPPEIPALRLTDPHTSRRVPVATLEPAAAPGYAESRVQLDALMSPGYLRAHLCPRARRQGLTLQRVMQRAHEPATTWPRSDACAGAARPALGAP